MNTKNIFFLFIIVLIILIFILCCVRFRKKEKLIEHLTTNVASITYGKVNKNNELVSPDGNMVFKWNNTGYWETVNIHTGKRLYRIPRTWKGDYPNGNLYYQNSDNNLVFYDADESAKWASSWVGTMFPSSIALNDQGALYSTGDSDIKYPPTILISSEHEWNNTFSTDLSTYDKTYILTADIIFDTQPYKSSMVRIIKS